MNFVLVFKVFGYLSGVFAFSLIPVMIYAGFADKSSMNAFFQTFILALSFALIVWFKKEEFNKRISMKEGLASIGVGWIFVCIFGALPYYFTGTFSFVEALFENTSSFTTTGLSVFHVKEIQLPALLVWRYLTQWIAGISVVLVFVTLMPQLGSSAANLFSAESQGSGTERAMPKTIDTVKTICGIYLGTTVAEIILLALAGVPLDMATKISMATISTGGFINNNQYFLNLDSWLVEAIVVIFMIIGSINFVIYYRLLQKQYKMFWDDTERKWYFTIMIGAVCLIGINLFFGGYYNGIDSAKQSIFQTVSVMSTTGFSHAEYKRCPDFSRWLLFYLALIGGCSGSTAGGIKIARLVLLMKNSWFEILRTIHPKMVNVIKMTGRPVPQMAIGGVTRYFFLYFVVFFLLTALYALDGNSLMESMSTIVSCMSNVGGSYGLIGNLPDVGILDTYNRIILILAMVLGRIELFIVIMLASPEFWGRKRGW